MWTALTILTVLLLLFALYFFLIFPRADKRVEEFSGLYVAHRGLHGGDIKENTMEAFKKAVDSAYGIELDVRLSSDKIPVINHDPSLKRVFGIDKNVSDMTAKELVTVGVPTFSQFLSYVDGRVPLIVEIKGEDMGTEICAKTAELLDNYKGKFCVESFNPYYLFWFKKNRKNIIRGQLATKFSKGGTSRGLLQNIFLTNLLLNVLSRPDFIAYEFKYRKKLSLKLCKLMGALPVCWTPRSQDELDSSKGFYKTFIFENFIPEK